MCILLDMLLYNNTQIHGFKVSFGLKNPLNCIFNVCNFPSFLRLLLNGTYDYIRHKILYVFLDHFPEGGRQDGWIADDYLRTFLTHNGLSRVVGARADDVFVINDADEIPAHEGLLFLKLFDGWTEPFAIHMRKVVEICQLVCVWSIKRSSGRLWDGSVMHEIVLFLYHQCSFLCYFLLEKVLKRTSEPYFMVSVYNYGFFSSLSTSSHCMAFSGSSLAL